jgi:hypothetical protein
MKDPFDFNGDGKVDPAEHYLGYKIYEELNKEDKNTYKVKSNKSDEEIIKNIICCIIILISLASCAAI